MISSLATMTSSVGTQATSEAGVEFNTAAAKPKPTQTSSTQESTALSEKSEPSNLSEAKDELQKAKTDFQLRQAQFANLRARLQSLPPSVRNHHFVPIDHYFPTGGLGENHMMEESLIKISSETLRFGEEAAQRGQLSGIETAVEVAQLVLSQLSTLLSGLETSVVVNETVMDRLGYERRR